MSAPKRYGLCCAGNLCKVSQSPWVMFDHRCMSCNQYLHAICGEINADDKTSCPACVGRKVTEAMGQGSSSLASSAKDIEESGASIGTSNNTAGTGAPMGAMGAASLGRGARGSRQASKTSNTAGTGHAAVGASSLAKDIEPGDPIGTLNTAGTGAAMGAMSLAKDIEPRASVGTSNTAGTGAAMGAVSSAKKTTHTNKKMAAPTKTTSQKKQKKDGGNIRIGVGKSVKIKRQDMFHTLRNKAQQDCI